MAIYSKVLQLLWSHLPMKKQEKIYAIVWTNNTVHLTKHCNWDIFSLDLFASSPDQFTSSRNLPLLIETTWLTTKNKTNIPIQQ